MERQCQQLGRQAVSKGGAMAGRRRGTASAHHAALSHFCEKARWGLHLRHWLHGGWPRAALPHVVRPERGRQREHAVMKLPPPDGACVDGSSPILRWVDQRTQDRALPRLFPAKRPRLRGSATSSTSKLDPPRRAGPTLMSCLLTPAWRPSLLPRYRLSSAIVLHCGLWYLIRSKMASVSGGSLMVP